MLKHIVTWKMAGETAQEREEQAQRVRAVLLPLADQIPEVQRLEVHFNELDGYNNWDVILLAEFADPQALAVYATHPAHLAAVAVIKSCAAGRAGMDFTV